MPRVALLLMLFAPSLSAATPGREVRVIFDGDNAGFSQTVNLGVTRAQDTLSFSFDGIATYQVLDGAGNPLATSSAPTGRIVILNFTANPGALFLKTIEACQRTSSAASSWPGTAGHAWTMSFYVRSGAPDYDFDVERGNWSLTFDRSDWGRVVCTW